MIPLVEQKRRFKTGNDLLQMGKRQLIERARGIVVVKTDCKIRLCGKIVTQNAQPANPLLPLRFFPSRDLLGFRGLLPDFPFQGGKLIPEILRQTGFICQI